MRNLFSSPSTHLSRRTTIVFGIAVAVAVVVVGWSVQQPWFPIQIEVKTGRSSGSGQAEETTVYTAVTLDNGQVFYGKVTEAGPYLKVTNAFYYKPGFRSTTAGNIRLVKVGTEVHEPEDAVFVNRSHVVMQEQMTSDSKVVKAMRQYQEEQKK